MSNCRAGHVFGPTRTPPEIWVCSCCGYQSTQQSEIEAHIQDSHIDYPTSPIITFPPGTYPPPGVSPPWGTGEAGKACLIAFVASALGLNFILPYLRLIRKKLPHRPVKMYYAFSRFLIKVSH